MAEQYGAAAGAGLHQPAQRGDAGALALLAQGIEFADALAGAGEIVRAPEEMRFGGFAVAACAARFLIIALDRLGQRRMGDEADVGLDRKSTRLNYSH